MKTNVITKEVMVERINNRFEQVFMNELPYKNDIQLFNTSKLIFNWFINYKFNNQPLDLIKSIYNLSKVDFLDLISSFTHNIYLITYKHHIVDINKISRLPNKYINVDGLVVSQHTEELGNITLNGIIYTVLCFNQEAFDELHIVTFSKFE